MTGHEYIPLAVRDGVARASNPHPLIKSTLLKLLPPLCFLILGVVIGIHHPTYLSIYSRRSEQTDIALLPRALLPQPTTLVPPVSTLPKPLDPVPNVVHYVYGLAPPPQPDFPYFAYLAMRSALVNLKPDKVMFHCVHEPKGYWWERVKAWEGWEDENGHTKGLVEVIPAREVEWIGKARRPVVHFAHKADIIRLEVLLQYGGIYLDIDTFVLRSFAEHSLLQYDTVLGIEANWLSFLHTPFNDDEMHPKGLCNAVIVARQGAVFLERWLESYEGFREGQWTEHSVQMPWTLAQLYPTTVTVLSERAFFWPLWTDDHIAAVYDGTEYDFDGSGQLAYHAWESKARQYLSALDPVTIGKIDTSFTRMARRYQEPEEVSRWQRAGSKDGSQHPGDVDSGTQEGEKEVTGRWGARRRV